MIEVLAYQIMVIVILNESVQYTTRHTDTHI